MKEREHSFDNAKAILIFMVVFGHLIEPLVLLDNRIKFIYMIIYSIHMPTFIFISGYFCKENSNRLKKSVNLFLIYFIFQIIYIYFSSNILNVDMQIQFKTPYWILWFLIAIAFYNIFIEFIEVDIFKFIGITVIVIWISGENKLGYDYSLARIVYYLPFFLLGYLMNNNTFSYIRKIHVRISIFILFIIMSYGIFKTISGSSIYWFYGSIGWKGFGVEEELALRFRLYTYLASVIGILFIMAIMPRKKTFLSYIGNSTMAIYLIHGFIVKLAIHKEIYLNKPLGEAINIVFKLSIAIILFVIIIKYVYLTLNHIKNRIETQIKLKIEKISV